MRINRLTNVRVVLESLKEDGRDGEFVAAIRLSAAKDLLEKAERHLDVFSATLDARYETVCSHCGYQWHDTPDGPECCQKAQDEWDLTGQKINQG